MKAYNVRYNTATHVVFEEIVLVHDDSDIETTLAEKSDKGFCKDHPDSVIKRATEIPLHKLPLSSITVADMITLIQRVSGNQTKTKST